VDAQEWMVARCRVLLPPDVLLKVASLELARAAEVRRVVARVAWGVAREIRCWAAAQGRRRQASEAEFRSELNLAQADEPPWAQGELALLQAHWPEEQWEPAWVAQVPPRELC
jgi:hypothetical protein